MPPRRLAAVVCAVMAALTGASAHAQITWTGTSADANWGTSGAWSSALPNNFNQALVFQGTSLLSNTNTLTGGTATSITFNAGAGAFTITGSALSLSGNLANNSSNLQTLGLNINLVNSSTFTGASVTLSGTLIQQGSVNRSINNNLDAGQTLTLGDLRLVGTGNTPLTLTLNGTGNTTFSGVIMDGTNAAAVGSLTIYNTATTTFSVANNYSGTTLLNGATFVLNNNKVFGSSLVTFGSRVIVLQASTTLTDVANNFRLNQDLTFAGANSIKLTGTMTQQAGGRKLTNNLDAAKTLTLGNLILSGTDTAPLTLTLAGAGNTTLAGIISDGTAATGNSLTITNTGTTTLSSNNSYAGPTTLSGAGTVVLEKVGAFGTGTVTIGTTVTLQASSDLSGISNAFLVTNNPTFSGSSSIGITGTLTQQGGARTITSSVTSGKTLTLGAVLLTGTDTTARNLTLAGTGNTTFAGVIANGTAVAGSGLIITNTGTTTLSGANTFTGNIVASGSGGRLVIGGAGQLSGTTGTYAGSITGTNVTFEYASSANSTLSGAISGTMPLVQSGLGTLTLSGTNTFDGGVTLTRGQLTIGSTSAFGTGAVTITSGSLDSSSTLTNQRNNTQNWNGDFTFVGSNALNLGTGAVTLGGNRTVTVTSSTLTVGGVIDDGINTYGLTKAGVGTLVLGGANTFGGATTVREGMLEVASANALPVSTTVTVGGGVLNIGSYAPSVSSFTITSGSLTGSGTVTATNYALNGGAVNANLGAGSISSSSGTTTLSGAAAATSITINGGSLVLGASNRLASTGTVSISAGSLDTSTGYSNSFNSFTLSGGSLLGSGTVTSVSGYALQGGAVNAVLGPGAITVSTGTTTLGSAGRFNSNSGLTISSGQLALSGSESVSSYSQSGGTLGGSGKLTAATYGLGGGTVTANLGNGTLNVTANSALNGTSDANTVNLNAGTLTLGSGGTRFTSSSVAVSGSAGASLTLGGSETFGSLAGAANVALGSYTLTVGSPNTSTTYSGGLSGAGGLTKLSSGTFTLSGANTYGGATQVNAGVLALGASGVLSGSTAVTVGGGELSMGSNSNTVGSFAITSGSVTGSGKLTAATYGLGGGTVTANLGNGTLNATANSTLNGTSDANTVNLNAGSLTLGSGGTRFTSSSVAVSGSAGASLTLGGSETFGSLAGAANVALGGNTLSIGAANTSTNYSGVLSGAGSLTKVGSGAFTLANANTYTGATTISSGTVIASVANAISASSAITLGSASSRGFLKVDDSLTISSLTFTGSGGDVVDGSQGTATFSATSGTATITVDSGSNVFHAAATLASPTLLNVSSGAIFTFHNNISGSATFTKQGLGTLNIVGDNDGYSGSFLITAGRVNIGSGMNQIGTGTTTLSGGATLDLGGQAFTDRIVVLNGTILNAGGTATTTTITGISTVGGATAQGTYNITSTGSALFDVAVGDGAAAVNVNVNDGGGSGGRATFAQAIGAKGNVTVWGGGTAAFNGTMAGYVISHGASTFNGNVLSGNVQVNSGAAGTGSALFVKDVAATVTVQPGAAAEFRGLVSGLTTISGSALFASASGLSGSMATDPGGVATLDNVDAEITGSIHNDGLVTVNRASGSQKISGLISGTGSIVKQGAGELVLSGSSTFTGATTISAGVVSIAAANALGSTSGVSIAGGAGLTYTGGAGSLDRAITVASGIGTVTNSGAGTLTLAGTLTKNGTVLRLAGGAFNVTGQIVGANSNSDLYVDAASVTLSNANTYNGPTFVFNGGTLVLGTNSAIPDNSVVTLGGPGAGTLNLAGYSNSVGGLIFSSTGSGGTLKMAANQTGSVQLASGSSLSLGAGTTLDLTGMNTSAGLYRLVSATSLTGTFASVTGLDSNYVLRYGTVNANEIDAQRKANQAATFVMTTGSVTRALVNTTVSLSGTIENSSPVSATELSLGLGSTGQLSVTGLTTGNVTAGSSRAITGTLNAGANVGTQSWTVTNTDNSAITTLSTATGSLQVVNQRSFTTSVSTIAFGNVHQGKALSSSFTVTSTGLNDTTANASLGSFSGGPSGLSLTTSDPTAFNGGSDSQSATYALAGTANTPGSLNGTFSSKVTAELGSINDVTLAVTGNVYSGQATWTGTSGGSWGSFSSGFGSNWGTNQGSPGLDSGYANTDTATFAGTVTGGTAAIDLTGVAPSLKEITLNNSSASYLLSNGSITMSSDSGTASLNVNAGSHEIASNLWLASLTSVNTGSGAILTLSGSIGGSGDFVKTGVGTLNLMAANTYSGNTQINDGTLKIGTANAFGNGGTVILSSGATLDLSGFTVANAITNKGGTIRGGTISGTVSGSSTLSDGQTTFNSTIATGAAITIASTGTASFGNGASIQSGATIANDGIMVVSRSGNSGALTIGAAVSGAGQLQIDSGRAVLEAVNDYRGNTVISGSGSLALGAGGSFANSQTIVVGDANSSGAILDLTAKSGTFAFGSDQTLKGGGTIQLASNGVLEVQGTFAPGNSPGLFTYDGGTTLLSGTTIMEIWGPTRATLAHHDTGYYDAVNVINGGIMNFNNSVLTLDFNQSFIDNTSFDLFMASGTGSSLAGNFSSINVTGSYYTGLTWTSGTNGKWTSSATKSGQSLEFNSVNGQLVIIPEPDTIIFAGIGIAMAGWSLWKRRRIAHILRHHRHTP